MRKVVLYERQNERVKMPLSVKLNLCETMFA